MFDYSKLKGRIKESCDTQENFANALGISATTLSSKLNNKVEFRQSEIRDAITILNIQPDELQPYFFNTRVPKSEQ